MNHPENAATNCATNLDNQKLQPRMENDGQPGILIHKKNGFHTELGSPFPGWKIISTHYQGFRNNVQINVQATSKHVVGG